MNIDKHIRRAAKRNLACYSWRGEDFELESARPRHVRYAKRVTARRGRRLSKALALEVGS